MRGLLNSLKTVKEYQDIFRGLQYKNNKQLVFGLSGSQKPYLSGALIEHANTSALIMVPSEHEAVSIKDDLTALLPTRKILCFPVMQLLPYQVIARGWEVLSERIKVLEALADGEKVVVIATPEAFIRRLTPPIMFNSHRLTLSVGNRFELSEMRKKLVGMGYEWSPIVEGHGQFSVRGGIIDVFPMTMEVPIRIEMFDDEIDSIRTFDIDNQRSVHKLQEVKISPATELILEEEIRKNALNKIKIDYDNQLKKINKKSQSRKALEEMYREAEERISAGLYFAGIDHYLPYFYSETVTLSDYLPPDTIVIMDEPVRWKEAVAVLHKERSDSFAGLLADGKALPGQYRGYIQWDEVMTTLERQAVVFLSFLPRHPLSLNPAMVISFPAKGVPAFLGKVNLLVQEVADWKRAGYAVVLMVSTVEQGKQLVALMKDADIDAYMTENLDNEVVPGNIAVVPGNLSNGFEMPTAKLVVITGTEMYGRQKKIKSRTVSKPRMDLMSDLKSGDYVVHINHGIGRYLGIKKLDIGGIGKDYLTIKYAGEDKLYVPTDQVGMIQKYLGGEADAPKLSKMGGAEWNRVKSRVKESVREMAKELLALYAAREKLEGYAFSPDSIWQKDFEDFFPYEETVDQIRAIKEVKDDMERSRPMDRLLCGDVGYGKTEVALRAAFKAVMDSKQVAMLVPTTILAQQHYNTFKERFAEFPLRIEMLSRFRSPKEQRDILKDLSKGKLDIVIGTHRLVQEDVSFKNLGLVVVDEEQRFGVAHKEKLKLFKHNVDVLTLTATPIPRTLHMSLVGVRDTSILETPPVNRFPVQTYVLEEEPALIRESIYREMGRGGQVFFVHNRVQELDNLMGWIQSLVPEARLAVAHGQMREDQLERVMIDYIDGNVDVLICTTIIESGLDIPNVNTLIVKDSNNMGLAQLYQLRGRVGRSHRIAYAYFTYRRDKILSEVAEKRLSAIKEFTAFGSGYKIALKDLEIRGAGNLLGPEQHGHIDAVGFDLYCRLLEDAVLEAKGGKAEIPVDTLVELPVDAFIPENYINDSNQKVEIYRRLASIPDESLLEELTEELEDRFGDPPPPVQRLLKTARIRLLAGKLRIKNISEQSGSLKLQLVAGHNLTGEKLISISNQYKNRVKFVDQGDIFEIRLRSPRDQGNYKVYLGELEEFVTELGK